MFLNPMTQALITIYDKKKNDIMNYSLICGLFSNEPERDKGIFHLYCF